MVHRMPKEKTTPMQPRTIASSKTDQHHRGESHKTASLPKHHRKDQNSKKLEAELSSRKLYGQ
jgi:hypothetical protein